jgi:hypothetical protein
VANDSNDSITGTFSGLPEGAIIPWPANPNLAAQISYSGGTNNDVVLTLVDPFQVTVTNNADNGAGSLRQAIINAAAAPGINTVTFDSSLSGAQIGLLSEITINDPAGVIIDASALSSTIHLVAGLDDIRLVHQVAGSTTTIRGLWLANGDATGDGGAILNEGNLTLESCALSSNEAANGGAIQNHSQLTAHQCTLALNTSTGSGAARAGHQQVNFTQLRGGGDDGQGSILDRGVVVFDPNERLGHQATPISLSLATRASTSATLMPALRTGGSLTLRVMRRGAMSTP